MTQSRIFERAQFSIGAATPAPPRLGGSHDARAEELAGEADAERNGESARPVSLWQHAERTPFKKRALLLAAVIAVPAMAAPGDFGALPGDAAQTGDDFATRKIVDAALPFERPGQSFPGSAFYYLGDPPEDALLALPTIDAFDTGAEGARRLGSAIDAGPAANPFFSSNAGAGHMRALDCMAQAVWYEAASESTSGQRAVAQVVLNRVAHPSWPGSVCGVVYEGSQRRTGCQFSFTCDGSLSRRARGASWEKARRIASEALSGSVYAPIGHATHYHTLWVNPYWASSLDHIGTIGAHRFYRNRGSAGEKSAFTDGYNGLEPAVSGRIAALPPGSAIGEYVPGAIGSEFAGADGTQISSGEAAAETGAILPNAAPSIASSPKTSPPNTSQTPRYADPALEGSGSVKSGFSNAGQWKKRPGQDAKNQSSNGEQAANKDADPTGN